MPSALLLPTCIPVDPGAWPHLPLAPHLPQPGAVRAIGAVHVAVAEDLLPQVAVKELVGVGVRGNLS